MKLCREPDIHLCSWVLHWPSTTLVLSSMAAWEAVTANSTSRWTRTGSLNYPLGPIWIFSDKQTSKQTKKHKKQPHNQPTKAKLFSERHYETYGSVPTSSQCSFHCIKCSFPTNPTSFLPSKTK